MSKKNKRDTIIIMLVIVGIICWLVAFWVHEQRQSAERVRTENYINEQKDTLTHDIEYVKKYKSEYMGDSNNNVNLFAGLPLNDVPRVFEQNSKKRTITVYYQGVDWYIGAEKVKRDLIYNSTAAFALIDNLDGITYKFCGSEYKFKRKQVEKVFGKDLSDLLEKDTWNKKVRDKLKYEKMINKFYE